MICIQMYPFLRVPSACVCVERCWQEIVFERTSHLPVNILAIDIFFIFINLLPAPSPLKTLNPIPLLSRANVQAARRKGERERKTNCRYEK